MRIFILTIAALVLLSGCVRYVPAECQEPPALERPAYESLDSIAEPSEQIRGMVDRFSQCVEYSRNLETYLEEYRK